MNNNNTNNNNNIRYAYFSALISTINPQVDPHQITDYVILSLKDRSQPLTLLNLLISSVPGAILNRVIFNDQVVESSPNDIDCGIKNVSISELVNMIDPALRYCATGLLELEFLINGNPRIVNFTLRSKDAKARRKIVYVNPFRELLARFEEY